jgi:hypothetical protein
MRSCESSRSRLNDDLMHESDRIINSPCLSRDNSRSKYISSRDFSGGAARLRFGRCFEPAEIGILNRTDGVIGARGKSGGSRDAEIRQNNVCFE